MSKEYRDRVKGLHDSSHAPVQPDHGPLHIQSQEELATGMGFVICKIDPRTSKIYKSPVQTVLEIVTEEGKSTKLFFEGKITEAGKATKRSLFLTDHGVEPYEAGYHRSNWLERVED